MRISHLALKWLAVFNNTVARKKWTAAYRAADNLAAIEQAEANPGEPVTLTVQQAAVTDLNEWRRLRRGSD